MRDDERCFWKFGGGNSFIEHPGDPRGREEDSLTQRNLLSADRRLAAWGRVEWEGPGRKDKAFPGKWLLSWVPKGKGKRAGQEKRGGEKLHDRKLVLESEAT